jgi:hypothetical protein
LQITLSLHVILYGALQIALSVANSVIFWLFATDKAIFKRAIASHQDFTIHNKNGPARWWTRNIAVSPPPAVTTAP